MSVYKPIYLPIECRFNSNYVEKNKNKLGALDSQSHFSPQSNTRGQ